MNKLKDLLVKLKSNLSIPLKVGIVGFALLSGFVIIKHLKHETNLGDSSVMIVNHEVTHGGTGIILRSTSGESSILTNDHVCRAINTGGIVISPTGTYQITKMLESELSDLCLISVAADLGVNTKIAQKAPEFYEEAQVSGHPALMPNVISTGHFSGRSIIQVMTGVRKCTDEELSGQLGIICAFFGGIPVVKNFESILVTATIMPGSSGSGVYNKDKELSGVVFAGKSDFGYAWTVPYEQVVNFLFKEHKHLKTKVVSQEINILKEVGQENKTKEVLQKCAQETNEEILNFCEILKQDMTWVK